MNKYEIYQALREILWDIEEHEVYNNLQLQMTNCYIKNHKILIAKNVCKRCEQEISQKEAQAVIAGFPPEGS